MFETYNIQSLGVSNKEKNVVMTVSDKIVSVGLIMNNVTKTQRVVFPAQNPIGR